MFNYICIDYISGLILSLRLDLFLATCKTNPKLSQLVNKIAKYNIIFHCSIAFIYHMCIFFGWRPLYLYIVANLIMGQLSNIFHILHFMDLLNIVSPYGRKTSNNIPLIDLLGLGLTMGLYQFVIHLTILTLDLLVYGYLWLLIIPIKIIILALYHSFYCYNNLWHFKKIAMQYRIDMHERLWPYYLGYGTIAAMIYCLNQDPVTVALYNIYMIAITSIPFLVEPRYPSRSVRRYPNIDLSIFSYITNNIVNLSCFICRSLLN